LLPLDLIVTAEALLAGRGKLTQANLRRAISTACADTQVIPRFPRAIENFANAFVAMQSRRHAADYDPDARFTKSAPAQDVATARQAILDFAAAPVRDRRAFCAFVLFRRRP